MSVVYQEITDPLLIPECVTLQKTVFGFSAEDSFPASFYSLLIRKEHPLGMLIGCFSINENKERRLIGLATLMADKSPKSLYWLTLCFLPEFQNGIYAFKIILAVRDNALSRSFAKIFGIYDPLESNLGKLYTKSGAIAFKYIPSPYKQNTDEVMEIDKVLFQWNIANPDIMNLDIAKNKLSFKDILEQYPIATDTTLNNKNLLVEIPNNFIELIDTDINHAKNWRSSTKKILSEYLNIKKYKIISCISGKTSIEKKTYYILSKN